MSGIQEEFKAAIEELSKHERALGQLVIARREVNKLRDITDGRYGCQVAYSDEAVYEELCNKATAAEKAVKILRDSVHERLTRHIALGHLGRDLRKEKSAPEEATKEKDIELGRPM